MLGRSIPLLHVARMADARRICVDQLGFADDVELGVEDSSDSSDATSGSELVSGPRGCALATPALELGPLGLFVLVPIVVRRRSSPKR